VVAMVLRYFDGIVPPAAEYDAADLVVQDVVAKAVADADAAIETLAIHEALAAIWTIVDELNGYITTQEPWSIAKDESQRERLGTVLYTAAEGLRALAVLLSPVIPAATARLWESLGAGQELGPLAAQPIRDAGRWGQLAAGTAVNGLEALFPRIEATVV
jgi:methionyl-tRNA synthetase